MRNALQCLFVLIFFLSDFLDKLSYLDPPDYILNLEVKRLIFSGSVWFYVISGRIWEFDYSLMVNH